jgi:hypothetical protein
VTLREREAVTDRDVAAFAERQGGTADTVRSARATRPRVRGEPASRRGAGTRNPRLREPLPDEQLAHVRQRDRLWKIFDERSDLIEHVSAAVGG